MSICLCMIVKNETAIIERCLESVKNQISHYVICDTGSTDDTIDKIKTSLSHIPGQVVSHQWHDFSTNKNMSINAAAKSGAEWILLMDADETLEIEGVKLTDLLDTKFESYILRLYTANSNNVYCKRKILRKDSTYRFEGVTHEALVQSKPSPELVLDQVKIIEWNDSARRKSGLKYIDDLILLEKEFKKNPNARNCFYLARTYYDLGFYRPAELYFSMRVKMGGWNEEVYMSLFQLAIIKMHLTNDVWQCLDLFLLAYNYRPSRSEALAELCSLLEVKKAWNLIYVLTKGNFSLSKDVLFVDKSSHWRVVEMHAIAANYLGNVNEAKAIFEHIINTQKLNENETARFKKNLAIVDKIISSQTQTT